MQYRLRTLLIVLAVGPVVIAILWPVDASPPNRRRAMVSPQTVEKTDSALGNGLADSNHSPPPP